LHFPNDHNGIGGSPDLNGSLRHMGHHRSFPKRKHYADWENAFRSTLRGAHLRGVLIVVRVSCDTPARPPDAIRHDLEPPT
jgi:hypothetical protein